MKIENKIKLGFSVPALILLFICAISYINTAQLAETAKWTAHTHEVMEAAESFLSVAKDLETGQRGFILTGEERYLEPYNTGLEKIYVLLGKLKVLTADNPEQQKRLETITPLLEAKIEELHETIMLRRNVGLKAALDVVLTDHGKEVMDKMRIIIHEFEEAELKLLAEREARAQNTINLSKASIITSLILTVVSIYFITKYITRLIVPPLIEAIKIAEKISSGEKNILINRTSDDETGNLLSALKTMNGAIINTEKKLQENKQELNKILQETNAKVDNFLTLITKVAKGDLREKIDITGDSNLARLGIHLNTMTSSLASLTVETLNVTKHVTETLSETTAATNAQVVAATQQANAVVSTTTTLESIRQTSMLSLNRAKKLGASSERTMQDSELGLDAVEKAVTGMESIHTQVDEISQTIFSLSEHTQQIEDIISVLEDLSQQSKMLSLNASIEAAKAGEAGQGFSVVASEVRELAEQSQQSTEQVKKILQDIRSATNRAVTSTKEGTNSVELGVTQVKRVGEVMHGLNEVIADTMTASHEIVAAVHQEAKGIEQVNASIGEINQSVQHFLASTKQTQAANNNLNMFIEKLRNNVKTYKI